MSVPLTVTSSSPNSPPGQAALGLVAGIPSKAPTSSPLAAEDLLVQLQNAISSGNEEQAQFLALQLAKQKTKVSISPKEAALQQQKDRVVRVKIYVEDRQRTGSFIFMNLNPAMKFEDLKKKMLIEYGFPPEVQVWIVGQRIARDTDTLDKRDINKPGASMHLYLRSAESVGLTPHDYRIKYGHLLPSDLSSARVSAANEPIRNQPRTASPIVNLSSQPASSPSYLQREIHRPIAAEVSPIAKYGGDRAPPRASPIRDVHPATMPRDRRSRNLEDISRQSGWACSACTYINIPTRPGCEICGTDRPATYRIPEKIELPLSERLRLDREKEYERMMQERMEAQRFGNYRNLMQTDGMELVANPKSFTCSICFDDIAEGDGVVLRECLHTFCKECLVGQIEYSSTASVKCPFQDESYTCNADIQDRDIRALCDDALFERHLQRSLSSAETLSSNSYHCKMPDCVGWCEYEDEVNIFHCPVCNKQNCLTCKAIHEGQNCGQYQMELQKKSKLDKGARKTIKAIQKLLKKGDAFHCPRCNVVLQKKDGCDWVLCTMCQLEICWVTKQPRWGPQGNGDISGGCKCRVNGRKCHKDCINCH